MSEKRQKEKTIPIRVSSEEKEIIEGNAKKLKMTTGNYVRHVAMNPTIIQENYNVIFEHTKEITGVRNAINRMIFSIEASNNYLPREIETIVFYMNEIFKSENKLLRELRRERRNERRKNKK